MQHQTKVWILVQLIVVGVASACGSSVDPLPSESSRDGGAKASSGGRLVASGGSSTGGSQILRSSGGALPAINHDCSDSTFDLVEPPCSEQDILVSGGCGIPDFLEFAFEFQVSPPPEGPLSLVLLPLTRWQSGQGGEGGESSDKDDLLALEVKVFPPEAGTSHGNGFSLLASTATLSSRINSDWLQTRSAYLKAEPLAGGSRYGTVYIGHIAVMSGTEPVWEQRILMEARPVCLLD